ncbi:MAG: response regulator [Cyanobacteria bacterium SZAS LIN-3]|nr:response regulator [Cyanobacteria bacterium SZAS LIN-3]
MKKNLLIVDDEAIHRFSTASAMKLAGFAVDQAANGLDALRRFISNQYDVILIDYEMPLMNGAECAQKIREYELHSKSKTVIIGLLSIIEEEMEEKCLAAGMDALMKKTCSTGELQQAVTNWTNSTSESLTIKIGRS